MRGKLSELLAPEPGTSYGWETAVPIATNPFTLMELLQMCLTGAGVGLAIMASGLWIVGGGLQPGDVSLLFAAAGVFLVAVAAAFIAVSLLFFGNRYYAEYNLTKTGVYCRLTRGRDQSGQKFAFAVKPFPVEGYISGKTTKEKELPWDKTDHFVNFPEMRSVQLKRGWWHMMRLYSPDAETHNEVVTFLSGKLREKKA
ncbi:MAG: hypothetical protein DELT_01077 [Desulfovibrio sp.]